MHTNRSTSLTGTTALQFVVTPSVVCSRLLEKLPITKLMPQMITKLTVVKGTGLFNKQAPDESGSLRC